MITVGSLVVKEIFFHVDRMFEVTKKRINLAGPVDLIETVDEFGQERFFDPAVIVEETNYVLRK